MAQQRRHQRTGNPGRWPRRLAGLVLGLALTLVLGCDGALKTAMPGLPDGQSGTSGGGSGGGGGDGGGGGGGGGNPMGGTAGLLVGSWQNIFLMRLENDAQKITTTWQFRSDRTCRRTVDTFSVLLDGSIVTVTDCTWAADGFSVTVIYAGNASGVTFSVALSNFSPNRLILNGILFDRVG